MIVELPLWLFALIVAPSILALLLMAILVAFSIFSES